MAKTLQQIFAKNQIFPLARVGIFSNHSAASREIAGLPAIEAGVPAI
jgi:hypothetical protein